MLADPSPCVVDRLCAVPILTALVARYDWPGLAERIPVRCFQSDPSIKSSLAFLRRTLWAREKVEGLYLFMLREQRRNARC
jgi:uncharacterized protein (DUF2132 family)